MFDVLGEALVLEGLFAVEEAGDDGDDSECLLGDIFPGLEPLTGRPLRVVLVVSTVSRSFLLSLPVLGLHLLKSQVTRVDFLNRCLLFFEHSRCLFGYF